MKIKDTVLGLRSIARHILLNCHDHRWTLQGFGMLRLHLPGNHRLHVWNEHFAVTDVSTIHDHLQWGLHSTIIAGGLTNRILEVDPAGRDYRYVTIRPGIQDTPGNVQFKHEPDWCSLREVSRYHYGPGDTYQQEPHVIHESLPQTGTVTLIRKTPTTDESARIFWRADREWVSAEPRAATRTEVGSICGIALAMMDVEEGR